MVGVGLKAPYDSEIPQPALRRWRIADFVALLKPRPMAVVLLTAIAGLLAAPVDPGLETRLMAILAIAAGGGGAAALNMWFERDIDARMARTARRPIPSGRVTANEALLFALVLIAGAMWLMAAAAGAVAATVLALTILFYGVVYTMWLKRATALNVVVGGGLASLLTPLSGWAAATKGINIEALSLFAFLVPWTPPHVWSQALVRASDYRSAGVPMMPVVAGVSRTCWLIFAFTVVHSMLALWPSLTGATGVLWTTIAAVGGAGLVVLAFRLAVTADAASTNARAWRLYRWNSVYVAALLAALVGERLFGLGIPISALSGNAG